MSGGIWFTTPTRPLLDADAVAVLLPINRFLGFFASIDGGFAEAMGVAYIQ